MDWVGSLKSWIADWPKWWSEQSSMSRVFPVAFVTVWWASLIALGGFRGDHLNLGLLILILSYTGRPSRILLNFLLPLLMTGIVYDSQRFYSDYIRGPIHVTEPYNFDKRFFGISTPQGVLTPNEWFQLHTHPVLDLIAGFFYLTFVALFLGIAGYFRFWLGRHGTSKCSASAIRAQAPRLMWGFFWLNVVGYTTYYWYAAAPPWYVSLYGLGPANMSARPNPAGCIRFDQILGTHFFTEMYGRSADVFGAIPSLHIAYPLLAVYFAFKFGSLQAFSIFFFLVMCFSAVYLNHHYVLDLLWGASYAVMIGWLINYVSDRRQAQT